MSSKPTKLGSTAEDRKARLAKLKSLKRKQPTDEIVAPESAREGSAPLPPPPPPPPPPQPSATAVADESHRDEADQERNHTNEHDPRRDQEHEEEEEEQLDPEADVSRIILSGRNYDPEVRGPKLGFELPPTATSGQTTTLEAQAAEIEDAIRAQEREDAERAAGGADGGGVDLFRLQPKKPNWDLRRDLEKKLEVLAPRTQNAINRIVRERIEKGRRDAKAEVGAQAENGGSAAAAAPQGGARKGVGEDGEGVDGVALVEGLKVREREEEEEERREREDIEGMA